MPGARWGRRGSHLSEQGRRLQTPLLLPLQGPGVRLTQGYLWRDSPGRGPGSWKPTQGGPPALLQGRGSFGGWLPPPHPPSLPLLCPSLPVPHPLLVHPPPCSCLPCSPGLPALVSLVLTCPLSHALPSRLCVQDPSPGSRPLTLPCHSVSWSPCLPAPRHSEAPTLLPPPLAFPVPVLPVTCPQAPSSRWRALSSGSSSAPPPARLTFN